MDPTSTTAQLGHELRPYPVAPWPVMGLGVIVGPNPVFGLQPLANAANRRTVRQDHGAGSIGSGTIIGAGLILYAGVRIGADCRLGDRVTIREDTRIGARCVIGTNVDIQYGALIADDVRILNGAHIAGGTVIGDGSFIGPGVWTANDRHIDLADYQDRGTRAAPIIGKRVFVGVGAIILPGVTIGDGAIIAAGAVVVKCVASGAKVFGMPASAAAADRVDNFLLNGRYQFDGR